MLFSPIYVYIVSKIRVIPWKNNTRATRCFIFIYPFVPYIFSKRAHTFDITVCAICYVTIASQIASMSFWRRITSLNLKMTSVCYLGVIRSIRTEKNQEHPKDDKYFHLRLFTSRLTFECVPYIDQGIKDFIHQMRSEKYKEFLGGGGGGTDIYIYVYLLLHFYFFFFVCILNTFAESFASRNLFANRSDCFYDNNIKL